MGKWFSGARAEPYFCVVGHPVAHSQSPFIHHRFAADTGRALDYQRVDVKPGELQAALREFRDVGGRGMNVTLPLKEEAFALADEVYPSARLAAAANTLWFNDDGAVVADNTDGVGLVVDLQRNHGFRLASSRILVLGAGGAARGVLPALLETGPTSIALSNRTTDKARAVAGAFVGKVPIEVIPWGAVRESTFDLILNATSLSLSAQLPPLDNDVIGTQTWCYDMMYAVEPTVFMRWAMACGAARAVDGLGMLIEQAAAAFRLWHGVMPATAPVAEALRKDLASRNR